jgi:hypothetical protein
MTEAITLLHIAAADLARHEVTLSRALVNQTKITSVYNHGSRHLYLPTLVLAARNLFEFAPVLFEAPQITVLLRPWRLDFLKRGMRHQDGHEPSTAQHCEPHAPDGFVCRVA